MSNLRRLDPFGEMLSLRDAMNQLFEDSVVSPARMSTSTNLSMPMNVSETQDAFLVEAVVPGLKPEDLDITIQDNVLTIQGETRNEQQAGDKKTNYHVMERRYGRFSRSISLPSQVQADRVEASLEHGVLHLEIPKAEAVKPRRITVSNGHQTNQKTIDVSNNKQQEKERGA